jgi:hypothetical protein
MKEKLKSSELFDKILERPVLYIGYSSIRLIKAFIAGYEGGTDNEYRDALYINFNEWVAKRFKIETSHDWASIISFMALSESRAYEMTKELWEEYKVEVSNLEQPIL